MKTQINNTSVSEIIEIVMIEIAKLKQQNALNL